MIFIAYTDSKLLDVTGGGLVSRNGRWSEWHHNGAKSSKQTSSGFCLGLLRQRTIELDAKLLKAEPLFKNSHWKDIASVMATEHSTAVCGSRGVKVTYRFVYHSGNGNSFYFFEVCQPRCVFKL